MEIANGQLWNCGNSKFEALLLSCTSDDQKAAKEQIAMIVENLNAIMESEPANEENSKWYATSVTKFQDLFKLLAKLLLCDMQTLLLNSRIYLSLWPEGGKIFTKISNNLIQSILHAGF